MKKSFKEYFSKAVDFNDNKFAALNSAVWSGGSFIYCPENVSVEAPLQAYFRINSEKMGQFERTLIIIEKKFFSTLRRRMYSSNLFSKFITRRCSRDLY